MENETLVKIPNRLQFFPIMMFAIIMGLSGLTIVYKKASENLFFPSSVAMVLTLVTFVLFIAVFVTYVIKFFLYKDEVLKELAHPIRVNFFAASSISCLLLAIIFKNEIDALALGLFSFGAALHLFFTFYTIKYWINNNLEIQHSNPAWFIPIVGNLIVPIAGEGFVHESFLYFYFSIGIFFWIILFSIILNRIIFHKQFAPKFMPTMFILIAPPAIGFISYIKLEGNLDFFAHILYSLALFFTILVMVMYKNFINIKFFISWWAFTFPMAAITIATILMYKLTHFGFYEYLSYFLLLLTTFIVALVAKETLSHMYKKEICIME